LDRSFPFVEMVDAAETDSHLSVGIQVQQAGAHSPISAAPTARIRRLDEIATDGGDRHD
jgi:hypothetical protein